MHKNISTKSNIKINKTAFKIFTVKLVITTQNIIQNQTHN